MKKIVRSKKMIIGIVILSIVTLFVLLGLDQSLKIVTYNVASKKINSEVKIAVFTDLHSCVYGENQIELLRALESESPDLVLLGGDIFDDRMSHDGAIALLKGIQNRYPSYYVTGNHEIWSGEQAAIKRLVKAYGITVLEGDKKEVEVNGNKITVTGIDDPSIRQIASEFENQSHQIIKAQETTPNSYNILLIHRPLQALTYLEGNYDIAVSGHAHGGQWRFPYLINGLLAPDEGFFPKYAGGRYDMGDRTLIVSRGLARESTRIPRLYNQPELVFINLTSK